MKNHQTKVEYAILKEMVQKISVFSFKLFLPAYMTRNKTKFYRSLQLTFKK